MFWKYNNFSQNISWRSVMTEYLKLFGTDGVRGVVNEWLTPERALRLSLAIGTYLGEGARVLVGRDARAGNNFITQIVIGGLISTGVKVYYAGYTPTPALQYYIKSIGGFDAGVMITASHNPPEYSGIKVIASDGVELPHEEERNIERIYYEEKFRRVPWNRLYKDYEVVTDVNEHYINGVLSHVDKDKIASKGFKVVVDAANNVASLTTPELLKRLNVRVIGLNTELSSIPNRYPEPVPENLGDASKAVTSLGADFGVAHDGDGDRAIFIDDLGRVISGDRSAVLLCKHIVSNKGLNMPKRVVTAVSSSTIIEDVLKEFGVEVLWTKVGSITIARTMMKLGAMAGFEENGGFMYPPHQYVRDGAMALALMLEFLSYEGKRLSELINELPRRYIIKTKVPLRVREEANKAIEEVRRVFGKGRRVIDIDGVKIIDPKFWILVRPSGTEPILRIFVEAEDEESTRKILNEVLSIIKGVLSI